MIPTALTAALLAAIAMPLAALAGPQPEPADTGSGVAASGPANGSTSASQADRGPAAQPLTAVAPLPQNGPTAAPGPEAASAAAVPQTLPVELVLDRRQRELLVVKNGQTLRRFPVAVGMPGWETPVGRFSVLQMQINPIWEHPVSGRRIPPGPDNPLGSRWIGFYRDCSGRNGFNGQEHVVVQGCVVAGFHGTPNRASVGQAASHGCVRLYDEHVRVLFDLVRIGTLVTVLP